MKSFVQYHQNILTSMVLDAYCALGISSLSAGLQETFLWNTAVFVLCTSHTHSPSQQQGAGGLTVITTVSSSLNLGMYLSPLLISASFRGLKRHITLTPHSAASTMAADADAADPVSGWWRGWKPGGGFGVWWSKGGSGASSRASGPGFGFPCNRDSEHHLQTQRRSNAWFSVSPKLSSLHCATRPSSKPDTSAAPCPEPDPPQRCVPASVHRPQGAGGTPTRRAGSGLACVGCWRRGWTRGSVPGVQGERAERTRTDNRIVRDWQRRRAPGRMTRRAAVPCISSTVTEMLVCTRFALVSYSR